MGSYVQPIAFACVIIDGRELPVELIPPGARVDVHFVNDLRYAWRMEYKPVFETATKASIMSKVHDKIVKRWIEGVERELDRFWKGIGANG